MTATTPDTSLAAPVDPPVEGHLVGRPAPAGDQPGRQVLTIAPPPGRPEAVVRTATAALGRRYRRQLTAAERTIEDHGLTIEATRLRERLSRAAVSDLERLLLSIPGVPEKLFNEAIEKQLRHERELADRSRNRVKDESVRGIAEKIEHASTSLEQSASVISGASSEIRDFTAAIAESLNKMVEIVSSVGRDRDVESTAGAGLDGGSTSEPGAAAGPASETGSAAGPGSETGPAAGPATEPGAAAGPATDMGSDVAHGGHTGTQSPGAAPPPVKTRRASTRTRTRGQ